MTQNRNGIEKTTSTTKTSSTTSRSTSSTSSTSRYTEPGVLSAEHDLMVIKEAYQSCIGPEIKAAVAYYIERLLEDGMKADVIIHAIEETGWARKPSPHYMRAILERYRLRGIRTMEQLLIDAEEWQETKQWFM